MTSDGPAFEQLTPSSGTGASQLFTVNFTGKTGANPSLTNGVAIGHVLINGALTGVSSCHIVYQVEANSLFLLDNLGSSWMGPKTPGVQGTLANGQCSIDVGAATVVKDPSLVKVTLRLPLAFTSYSGEKKVFLRTDYRSGPSEGWIQGGTWRVP